MPRHASNQTAHRVTGSRGKHRPERVEYRRLARLVFADVFASLRPVTA
jgi:hypothetical protein